MRIWGILWVLILIVGCANVTVYEDTEEPEGEIITPGTNQPHYSETPVLTTPPSSSQSEECDKIKKFDYQPADLDEVAFIKPMGLVQSEHVAPIDHIYLWTYRDSNDVEVYSPASGVVTSIQHMGSFRGDNNYMMDDYNIHILHDCVESNFIHIDELSDKLAAVAPTEGEYASVQVKVDAGEVIGTYSGSLDYMVIDKAVTLDFVNLESYKLDYGPGYDNRVHISDPIEYFSDPSKLIEKSLRTEEPIGGFTNYDIDGKLVGTWFLENTNGWSGINRERYWAGHLAIVYGAIDTDFIIVSTGDFEGRTGQFGVKGNAPDPGNVGVGELVKYELTGFEYYDGDTKWDMQSLVKGLELRNDESRQYGVVLFELIEDRKLKVEFFPGKKGSEVAGFTDNAKMHVR